MAEVDSIYTITTSEHISTSLTHQSIVAVTTVQNVIASTTEDGVVATTAVEDVVTVIALGLIFKLIKWNGVVDVAACKRITTTDDQIITIQTEDGVTTRTAIQRVVAFITKDDAGQRIAWVRWSVILFHRRLRRSAANIDNVFNVLNFTKIQIAVHDDDGVVTAISFFTNDIVNGVNEVDVVSSTTCHFVSTTATVQNVVAIVTNDNVIVVTADAFFDVVLCLIFVVTCKDRNVVAMAVHGGELTSS